MSQILEAFRRSDSAPANSPIDGSIISESIPTDFDLSLQVYDGKICNMLASDFPTVPWLTYDTITSGIPNILYQDDVLNSFITWSGRSQNPNRITSAGLQLGTQGVHHIHRVRWDGIQDEYIVSLVSRFPQTHAEGKKLLAEYASIKMLYDAIQKQPTEIRDVIDVVEPIVLSSWKHEDEVYPVLCTKFDPVRGELSTNILSALPGNQQPSIPGLVLHYAYPFTDRMIEAHTQQELLMLGFMGKEERIHWQFAEAMLKQQWVEIAFGLGVLASATGMLPGNLQFNAGDIMGTIVPAQESADNMPHIQQLKLVSLKGGIHTVSNMDATLKVLRSYKLNGLHPIAGQYKYGLFSMLTDNELQFVVEEARKFVDMYKK